MIQIEEGTRCTFNCEVSSRTLDSLSVLPLQGLVNHLECPLEFPEFRAVNGHEFVARLRLVRLNRGIWWDIFSQTEDRIDSQKMLLIISLAFPGKKPIDEYFRRIRMGELADDAE